MDKPKLSKMQRAVYDYLCGQLEFGNSPTLMEICDNFGKTIGTIQDHLKALEKKGYITRSNLSRSIRLTETVDPNLVPVVGRVAAGTDVLAEENITEYINLKSMLSGSGRYFALRVRGDSMIEAGIHEDDYVIVREGRDFSNGDICVVIIENEAVVKRTYNENGRLRLKSENPAYEDRFITEDDGQVFVAGKVFWSMRSIE